MLLVKEGNRYQLQFHITEHALTIGSGYFGDVTITETPLITAQMKNCRNGETVAVNSEDFGKVEFTQEKNSITFTAQQPHGIFGIQFILTAVFDTQSVSWSMEVQNGNDEYSVMEVHYPMPRLQAAEFDLFEPGTCGKVIQNAGKTGFRLKNKIYPSQGMTMAYFAVYNQKNGIYMGIEDPKAAVKRFDIEAGNDKSSINVVYFGVNASRAMNSFKLEGGSRWQYFEGDWYDAAMLYADFVYREADWLPKINERGRTDLPEQFREVPYWICDYMPNSEYQRDNMPRSFALDADRLSRDHWVQNALALQRELDTPVAYHIYNWHEIPFNVEYPHFMPAKQEFKEGLKQLKQQKILVVPYINAVSWDMQDSDAGHEMNFCNTGLHGAVINAEGEVVAWPYPQTTCQGKQVKLAPICPSWEKWHEIIEQLVGEMEAELDIDGIYFDEVVAHDAYPCYQEEHGHLPGGGSHWVDNYNRMMERINRKKPAGHFYYSEGNSEPYMKVFDGFLTWMWVQNGEVPAFPAIYGGYIEMVGRYNMGQRTDDFEFFKYQTAKALLYGQQIGWYRATIIEKPQWLSFLKKIVRLRYRFTELFHCARMLRPPKVISGLPVLVTGSAHLVDSEEVHMEQVLSGAWQYRSKEKLVLFLINTGEEETEFQLTFSGKEYELERYEIPADWKLAEEKCTIHGIIGREDVIFWELSEKEK